MRSSGSPPRVWGRHDGGRHLCAQNRFTPTRVGTTTALWSASPPVAVHPHACGDDRRGRRRPSRSRGSPPRVWGRRLRGGELAPARRFTPTRVGTTGRSPGRRRARTVHPHACGDDAPTAPSTTVVIGSPPRVWGRLRLATAVVRAQRFTPTRVGTTACVSARTATCTVHPHACGDDCRSCSRAASANGSPPRVWGRPARADPGHPDARFTPTRVGTTTASRELARLYPVHPHACGDDGSLRRGCRRGGGSPPRVWGRPVVVFARFHRDRFTPTRVGTTERSPLRPRRPPVHPHACGDDRGKACREVRAVGSPPRVWGRHSKRADMVAIQRFTPHACGDDGHVHDAAGQLPGSPPRVWGRL